MKRSCRIGIAVIMTLMMVFASSGMAFAANGSQSQISAPKASYEQKGMPAMNQGPESSITGDQIKGFLNGQQPAEKAQKNGEMSAMGLSESLPVHRILNYSDVTLTPDATLKAQTSRNGKYVAETKYIQLKKGTLYLAGYADENNVTIGVIDSSGNVVGGNGYMWSSANSRYANSFDIPKSGSYYVITICSTSNTWTYLRATQAVDLQGCYLPNNKYYVVGHSKAAQTRTYKFNPKATGYLRIYADAKAKVTICNASGKVLARQVTVNYRPVFGVRANRTYQIKVSWPSGTTGMNRLKVVNGSWWPTNGTSKSKAKTLSKGKLQKGLVVAGENNIRWFKFKNTQSVVKITLTGGTNDQLVWYIYQNNKLISKRILTPSLAKMWNTFTAKKYATYYIKVQKLNSTSSGYYHVKFE